MNQLINKNFFLLLYFLKDLSIIEVKIQQKITEAKAATRATASLATATKSKGQIKAKGAEWKSILC